MSDVQKIGNPPWSRSEILDSIDEFSEIYSNRPIKDNEGGMKAPHMFALWFMAKKLCPDLIIESGIWKGQSTWLLETACPEAKIVSIDLNLKFRTYISESKNVTYSNKDFSEHDWSNISDRSLVFFDDHQNAYKRLQQCKWFGFKHIIFEDNYPVNTGDCYSLKKAFAHAGFKPTHSLPKLVSKVLKKLYHFTPQHDTVLVQPNAIDSHFLHKHLEVYYQFPPIFKTANTRWGDAWDDKSYPTPEPLLEKPTKSSHDILLQEATMYTWICYTKLK